MTAAGELWLGIDAGTTLVKAVLFDAQMHTVAMRRVPVPVQTPHPGWVEQDPRAMVKAVQEAAEGVLRAPSRRGRKVAGVGICNQGETVVAWDGRTGVALAPAIVWQDRRTEAECLALAQDLGVRQSISERTGLTIDPYFSASKLKWLWDHVPEVQATYASGALRLSTTDSYILWHITHGQTCVTDPATASRTLLFDLTGSDWDLDLCGRFGVPSDCLPQVVPNAGPVGMASLAGEEIPITGLCVDQQAALFGHGAISAGQVKVTYGTGAFVLGQLGRDVRHASGRLLTTVAWDLAGVRQYAFDGGVFTAGAAVDWLVRLGLVGSATETEELASEARSDEVLFVPALQGLGAPHWDGSARGTLLGASLETGRAEIARAVLDGIAFRVNDILKAMQAADLPLRQIRADGGPTRNRYLMQRQADISGVEIAVVEVEDAAALGMAWLARLGADETSLDAVTAPPAQAVYTPRTSENERQREWERWQGALCRCRFGSKLSAAS